MARPTPLSGFPELLPAERLAEAQVVDSLAQTFELHGFAPLETRAVEPLDQLLRKGEIPLHIFGRVQHSEQVAHRVHRVGVLFIADTNGTDYARRASQVRNAIPS